MGRHHHTICLKIAGVFAPRPAPTPTALPRERLIGGQDGRPMRSPVGTVLKGSNFPFNEERTRFPLGEKFTRTIPPPGGARRRSPGFGRLAENYTQSIEVNAAGSNHADDGAVPVPGPAATGRKT
jgi:hypothetical protein